MRVSFLLISLFLSSLTYGQTTLNAIHPDCQQQEVSEREECTTSKIYDYLKECFEGKNLSIASLKGYIGLDISELGFLELSDMELEATTTQKDLIREAIRSLALRVLFIPAQEDGLPTFQYKRLAFSLDENSQKEQVTKLDGPVEVDAPVEEVFRVVEEMPRFPGCEEMEGDSKSKKACADKKMLQYIYRQIVYPAEARENKIEGTVVVQFVIEKNGSISNVRIVREIGAGCGEEVKRIVETMNDMLEKWTPGIQGGKPLRVQFNLPVKFRLG